MRLAALGFAHETNTFARSATTFEMIERAGIRRGDAIWDAYRDSGATMGGYLEAGERLADVQVVPLLFTAPTPSGTITRDAFERVVGEMLALLEQHGPWDAVLLGQHGAAVAEEYPDADGEVTARVRALVGPNVPIGLTPDMHANLSQRMVDESTVIVGYRTNPHLDARRRAVECATLVARAARGEVRPVQALETPPLVINILQQFTGAPPMTLLLERLEEVLARPGILSATVAQGYPYADVTEMGMAFLAIADGDADLARRAARDLDAAAWGMRDDFVGDGVAPEDALRRAMAAPAGPMVLMDAGDNVGGGSPGDSTHLLAIAQRLGARRYLQILFDPQAVAACLAAGVGARVSLRVGGKTDDMHGAPVAVSGLVRVLADGHFEDPGPTHGGARFFDQGLTAVLETEDGMTLVLTSKLCLPIGIRQLRSVGVHPEDYQVVVAKGVVSPRPAYEPIAAEILLVNTPGVTSADLSTFRYHHRRRPLFPFERDGFEPRAPLGAAGRARRSSAS